MSWHYDIVFYQWNIQSRFLFIHKRSEIKVTRYDYRFVHPDYESGRQINPFL